MSEIENELRSIVDAFVNDLSELVRRQAVEAIGAHIERGQGASAAPARAGGRPTRAAAPPRARAFAPAAAKRRPGEKRTPQELAELVERLFDYIRSNPGQPVEHIGRALAMPTKELTLPLRKLMNKKRLTSKGRKRATCYFPR